MTDDPRQGGVWRQDGSRVVAEVSPYHRRMIEGWVAAQFLRGIEGRKALTEFILSIEARLLTFIPPVAEAACDTSGRTTEQLRSWLNQYVIYHTKSLKIGRLSEVTTTEAVVTDWLNPKISCLIDQTAVLSLFMDSRWTDDETGLELIVDAFKPGPTPRIIMSWAAAMPRSIMADVFLDRWSWRGLL